MKILRPILAGAVLLIITIILASFFVYTIWIRNPLPHHSGQISIPGLNNTVEILRDKWGIPHIYATNPYDLFFAQGYTQAQDRFWQMDFSRRVASGRLSEIAGDSELGTDIFIRVSGWRRAAERDFENLEPTFRQPLEAFADGVNTYIASRAPSSLAFQYNILHFTNMMGFTDTNIDIEPWTPIDTLVFIKLMAWRLSRNEETERLFSKMIPAFDEEMFQDYFPPYPFDERPAILLPEDLPLSRETLNHSSPLPQSAGITGIRGRLAGNFDSGDNFLFRATENIGSNNWVVHGSITDTRSPLLANDPHLDIQMPPIWYEIGLHCQPVNTSCPYNVAGFAFPTAPGIIIGHNAKIAWGATNVGADIQDLYRLRINPQNSLQYEWNNDWRDMTVYEETIYVAGKNEPVVIQVRETHLGPVINDYQLNDENEITGFNNVDPLALRWTALEPSTIQQAVILLNIADNWREFREALQLWDSPPQNFVYADIEGNIGYQMPGKIPVRARGHDGLLPIDGMSDQFEWLGFLPYDLLPRAMNPERGWIASANQAVAPETYYRQLGTQLDNQFEPGTVFTFSFFWDYGYRASRIDEMLRESDNHSIQTFINMQSDNKSLSAAEILSYLNQLKISERELNDVRDWLTAWDYQMDKDSPQAALYASFWSRLAQNLYQDQLGDIATASGGTLNMWATRLLMDDPDNRWWDDISTSEIETRDDILLRSLQEAYDETVKALGENRDKWSWGALHTATFVSQPLGGSGLPPVTEIVNRGPIATGGGIATLNATSWDAASGNFEVQFLPSLRIIIDLGNFSNSLSNLTTGQSGHPASAHYDDMIAYWQNIDYHPMLWTREEIEQAAVEQLILQPAGDSE